ncbi:MAG: hypothetical protein Q9170_003469 [Blastenia crenularia]
MSSPRRVAIVGAGPGGLTLTRHLYIKQIPFRFPARGGLFKERKAVARSEGEDMVVTDKDDHRYYEEIDSKAGDRPEVDRLQLRGILLDSLLTEAVEWAHSIRLVTKTTNDKVEITLEGSSGTLKETYGLVVGADGAWSKARPLVTQVKPHYSTISGLDLRIHDVDTRHPEVGKLIGRGMFLALFNAKELFAPRNGDNSIRVNWPAETGVDFCDEKMAKDLLLKELDGFAPNLKDLFVKAGSDIVARSMFMFPVDHTWKHTPGVTLLGDAAHLMTPFAGEGVNLAMIDALDLGEAVASTANHGNLDEAISEYEQKMFARSHRSMKETWDSLELMFVEDAPKTFVEKFKVTRALGGAPPAEENQW